ncbi:MAG: hypothetical protein NC177_03450 [Ruminococcus flavefaciens]|nr:hypothetical protein [Ruminococcus flavefaciens]
MEAMKEAVIIIIEVLKGLFTMILELIKEEIPEEILITLIIMTGVVAIIYMIIKLSSKTPRKRKYRY